MAIGIRVFPTSEMLAFGPEPLSRYAFLPELMLIGNK